jgi:hypothetical protein
MMHGMEGCANVLVRALTGGVLKRRVGRSGPDILTVIFENAEKIGVLRHFTAFIHSGIMKWGKVWFVLCKLPIQPCNGRCLTSRVNAPHDVGAVLGNTQSCGLSIDPLEALETLDILGALDDETKVHRNALTKNSGIVMSVTRARCRFPHLAGPSGITAIERRCIYTNH